MRSEDLAILRECVLDAAFEALTAYSIPIERGVGTEKATPPDADGSGEIASPSPSSRGVSGGLPPTVDGPDELAAFIGWSGVGVRGTLTLVAPLSLVRDSYPVPLEGDDCTDEVFDWAGELVNQLMGRFKNKLLGRGLELHASTPQTVRASQLAVGRSARSSVCSLAFRAGASEIGVHFDAAASDGVVLFPEGAVAIGCMPEGALELF